MIRSSREHTRFILIEEQQVDIRDGARDIFQPPALRIPPGIERSSQPGFAGVPQRFGSPPAHLGQCEHIGQMEM